MNSRGGLFCHKEGGGFYHPRQPQQTPFYQLACLPKPLPRRGRTQSGRRRQVEEFYPQFEAVYEERSQARSGFWRPVLGTTVQKFLECRDLHQGFAHVRCPDYAHEFFVAFSCRGRCFCPSCLPAEASAQAGHQKRALQTALWVSLEVYAAVPRVGSLSPACRQAGHDSQAALFSVRPAVAR